MNYQVRLATIEDVKTLSQLRQKMWDENFRGIYSDEVIDNYDYEDGENTFKEFVLNDRVSLYVIQSNEELVGYMSVGFPHWSYKDYEQEIGLLYLRTKFQRKGIGKHLFELAYNEIKNNGYHKFFISCNKYNENARKFYEKMGGQLVDVDEDSENKRKVQVKYHFDIK